MDIVFVGAGRLATNLAHALHAAGHQITAVYSRTMTSAKALTERVGGLPVDSISQLPLTADAFILSVKDSVLADLIGQLAEQRADQLFFHTAGSVPMSVFGRHAHHGVIYPMQTFSKERLVDFSQIPLFIEASDSDALDVAQQIAHAVSQSVYHLSSEERKHLHLAAVFACNFANHCYDLSARILEKHGLPFQVMVPLIEETAEKVKTIHPHAAQTGPAIRYDENVITAQKQLLADEPEMQQIYDIMSNSIHRLAHD